MNHLTYRVCSLADFKRTAKSLRATHVVSLLDPHATFPAIPSRARNQHLCLNMHDLDGVDDGSMPGNPHPHHMDKILTFARNLNQDDRIVFHCMAGKRRSAAAALTCDIAFLLAQGAPPDAGTVACAFQHLRALRPQADPNRALLELADKGLGVNGALANLDIPPRTLDLSDDDYRDFGV